MYCVAALDVPLRVVQALDAFHERHPNVKVIVERRHGDRRRIARRISARNVPVLERRQIHGFDGRRVADRRAMAIETTGPSVPNGLRRHMDGVRYMERLAPAQRDLADVELARLVLRIQAGETALFADVYRRSFSDVFGYFRVVLGDHAEAEDAAQQVFAKALTALPRFELRQGTPFRAWLFRIARHEALTHMRKQRHTTLEAPDAIDRRREIVASATDETALGWISDPDLLAFIERLAPGQRQVLVLRFMLGMRTREIAEVLDKTDQSIRHMESRALRFLQQRLESIGRGPTRHSRAAMVMMARAFPVIRARRLALAAATPAMLSRRPAWRR